MVASTAIQYRFSTVMQTGHSKTTLDTFDWILMLPNRYLLLAMAFLLSALGAVCGSSSPGETSQNGTSSPAAFVASTAEAGGTPVTREATATPEPLGPVFSGFGFPARRHVMGIGKGLLLPHLP